jgi:hypothetical protein
MLGMDAEDLPNLKRWSEAVRARPAVERALQVGAEKRSTPEQLKSDDRAHAILFGGAAREAVPPPAGSLEVGLADPEPRPRRAAGGGEPTH